jgi:uncharacterized protein
MSEPATDIEVLSRAVMALGDHARSVGGVDGVLAAVLTCPEPIPPEEWLPLLWDLTDADEDFAFEETPETVTAVAEILKRYGQIAAELEIGGETFAPLYDVDGRLDDTLWELWIEGFEAGMSLRPEVWEAITMAEDDTADALRLLITLANIADGDPETKAELGPEQLKLLTDGAPDLLPECVQALYDANRPPGQPIIKGPKTGRNDPCPCGSGKKFKKCCGAG